MPPAVEAWSLNHWTVREVSVTGILKARSGHQLQVTQRDGNDGADKCPPVKVHVQFQLQYMNFGSSLITKVILFVGKLLQLMCNI